VSRVTFYVFWHLTVYKIFGVGYFLICLLGYLPFLFIGKEKFKRKIDLNKGLFFLPTVITYLLIVLLMYFVTSNFEMIGLLLFIVPNVILQSFLALHYCNNRYNTYGKLFKFFKFFVLFIVWFGVYMLLRNFSQDPLIQWLFLALTALVFLVVYVVNSGNKPLIYQSPIIPRKILWILPFLTIPLNYLNPLPESDLYSFLYAITICIAIGFAEEILFREILYRAFQKIKFPIYLLVSAILFGSIHFHNGLIGVVFATVVGLLYGLARIAGFPLYLLIICHAIVDIPPILRKYGNITEKIVRNDSLFDMYLNTLFAITILVAGIYLFIPKHWTNKLDTISRAKVGE